MMGLPASGRHGRYAGRWPAIRQLTVRPPSTRRVWPVTKLASATSQYTASAISSTVPIRANGVRASSASRAKSSLPCSGHRIAPARPH